MTKIIVTKAFSLPSGRAFDVGEEFTTTTKFAELSVKRGLGYIVKPMKNKGVKIKKQSNKSKDE
jgi:hypothetical protein